jgi:phosphoglycolate phosphatase
MTTESRALVLWDVDHTLIENGGVSKQNYALAFELLTGRRPEIQPQTDGRTDVGIMSSLLSANQESPAAYPPAQQWGALVEAGERNRELLAQLGHAMPGAEQALQFLADDASVIQSTLTGNIEANARLKLETFGLDRYLDFEAGAFGSESGVRAELVPIAQHKAAEGRGFDPAADVTVLIGDTELDVRAGLDGGARVIAVATGISSVEQLTQAGAHAVLPNLENTEAFAQALAQVRALGPAKPADAA